MWWIYLILMVISLILSFVMAPKPRQAQIGDLTGAPIASANTPIPVLFGKRIIKQPNVVWWGDVFVWPIKVSGGK